MRFLERYILIVAALVFLLMLFVARHAYAQVVVSEDFDYPTGSLAGQWSTLCSGAQIDVTTPGLAYPGYMGSGIGNAAFLVASGDEYKLTTNFNLTGSAYAGFLINVESVQSGGGGTCSQGNDFVMAYHASGGAGQNFNLHTGMILKSLSGSQFDFGIEGPVSGQILTNNSYDLNTTYLVVLALDQTNYYLYINPPLDGTPATPNVVYPTGVTYSTVTNLILGQNSYGHFYIDGIRITSTFSDLRGNVLSPEPTYPPSSMNFTGISSSGMVVSYTAGQDNPNSSLAVRNADAGVTFVPVDGAGYTVGEVVGTGQVISLATGCCTFTESVLQPQTHYFYRIFSANQTGDNSTINYLTSTYLEGSHYTYSLEPASDPATFTALAGSTSQINLDFAAGSTIANANGYVLMRRQDGTNPTISGFVNGVSPANLTFPAGTTYLAFINSAGVASLVDSGLPASTEFNYGIIAFNWDGVHSETISYHLSGAIKTASSFTLPAAPGVVPAISIAQTSFRAVWNKVYGAQGYFLAVSADNFASFIPGYGNLTVSDSTSLITGLSPGTTYQYRVRALNPGGASSNSNSVDVLTISTTPTASAASSISTVGFSASWGPATGASNYSIDVSNDAFANFATYATSGSSLLISGLLSGANYQYRVRSENASGASPYSNIVSFFTLCQDPIAVAPLAVTQTGFTATWNKVYGAQNYSLDVSADNFATFLTGYDGVVVSDTVSMIIALSPGATYQYRVRAVNPAGASANSNFVSVLTLAATPTAGAATSISTSGYSASWGPVVGAASYSVQVSSDGFVSSTSYNTLSTSLVITGLLAGTNYQYRVRSENASGVSPYSSPVSFVTLCLAPVAIGHTAVTQTGFTANWNSVTGATGYSLDVSSDNFISFVAGYDNLIVNDISAIVTGLVAGNNYQYRVSAINSSGSSGLSNAMVVPLILGSPAVLTVSQAQSSGFVINWAFVSGTVDHYEVDVSNNEFATFVAGYESTIVNAANNFLSVTNLAPATLYQFRVRAVGVSGASENSTSADFTLAQAPVALAASNVTQVEFTASWSQVFGASNYSLDVSTDNFATFVAGYNSLILSDSTRTIAGLSPGVTYQYRVRALSPAGASANSNIISGITIPETPTANAASIISATGVSASWSPAIGAANYTVEVSSDGFANFIMYHTSGSTLLIEGLLAGTNYQYKVRTENASGVSPFSNSVPFITLCSVPVAGAPYAVDQTGFTASWNSVTGATLYSLDVSTDSFATFVAGYDNLMLPDNTRMIAGLSPGTTYQYRVRALNPSGASANSSSVAVTTITATPIANAASLISTNNVLATWDSAAGANNYVVEVSSDGFSNATNYNTSASSLLIEGLLAGTNYQYRVRSENASGASPYSNSASFVTLCTAPIAAAPPSITQTGFMASWNSTTGATFYSLDVSSDNFESFVAGFSNLMLADSARAISGLSPGAMYQYRVRALNPAGASANSNSVTVLTIAATPTAGAASLISASGSSGSWSVVPGAAGYTVEVSSDGFANLTNYSTSGSSLPITGLRSGTNYQYRVRSENSSGGSPFSNVISFTTLCAAPVAVAPSAVTQTEFTANWHNATGATGYSLDVSSDNFATFLAGYNNLIMTDTSAVITGLAVGGSYQYRVRAINSSGSSSTSNIIIVRLIPNIPTGLTVTQTLATSFIINWTLVTGTVDHYEVDVSRDEFATFVAGYESATVSATSNFLGVTNLLPATLYQFRVRAVNSSGASEYATSAAYTLNSSGGSFNLQFSPPTFSSPPSGSVISTQIFNLGTAQANVLFYHRKITENQFSVQTVLQTDGKYEAPVSPFMFDELGVEFYFHVTDDIGRKDSTARTRIYQSFNTAASPRFVEGIFSGTFNEYQIVSIPYDLTDNLIETIFEKELGAYDVKKWRLGHYQDGSVLEFRNGINRIERGQGYWFNAKSQDSLLIRTGEGSAPKNDQNNPYIFSLSEGWNQIGNPYPFNIRWNDVLAANPSVTGVGELRTFVNGNFIGGDEMKSFTGGFVFSDGPVTLSVPVSLRAETGGRVAGSAIASDLDQDTWHVTFSLLQGDKLNNLGGIGMNPHAKAGKDEFDDLTLPRFGEYLEVEHPHPDYFYPHFSRDIVATNATHTWKFFIESSNESEEIELRWDNAALGAGEAVLFLLDVANVRIVNMRELGTYSFKSAGRNEFQIFFSKSPTDILLFDADLLGDAFPNPFVGSTTIPFVLLNANGSSVELSVYDLTGKKLRNLMAGPLPAGYHEATWDGTEDNGSIVSHGVYLYRLVVNGKTSTRRVIMK